MRIELTFNDQLGSLANPVIARLNRYFLTVGLFKYKTSCLTLQETRTHWQWIFKPHWPTSLPERSFNYVAANALDCDIVMSSNSYRAIKFTSELGKIMKPFIPVAGCVSHLHHHSVSQRHNTKDRRMKENAGRKTQEDIFRKIFTSHFIARVRNGCSRVCMWEGAGDRI